MRTLRSRLILSHILPLIIVAPLVSIALIYVFESQILLNDISDELTKQANLTADLALNSPEVWNNTAEAQQFVRRYSGIYQSEVRLLGPSGKLLASSEAEDSDQIGQAFEEPNLDKSLVGQYQVEIHYTLDLHSEIVQVLVPVVGSNQEVMGVVRMSQQLSDVNDQFVRFRYLIACALVVELILAIGVALALATNLSRYLRQVTEAINSIVRGGKWETLPEQGVKEIRRLLHAFNMLINRLRSLEESRRHLLANLVHEVGRPIGALESAIQAMLNGADEDPTLRRELLEGMQDQARRLHPLLDSLSDLHSQILGVLELNTQSISLSDWLPRAVSSWREAAHAKGLHWHLDVSRSLPTIEIDPDRLAQILGNLLSNAIKYTSEGTISVEAGIKDDAVAIVISDTGIGISPPEQKRIFEPFYRSRRDKRFPQGMGLGLSIANDLVVAHGGRLEIESEPGQGSRFTVWLPQQSSSLDVNKG